MYLPHYAQFGHLQRLCTSDFVFHGEVQEYAQEVWQNGGHSRGLENEELTLAQLPKDLS